VDEAKRIPAATLSSLQDFTISSAQSGHERDSEIRVFNRAFEATMKIYDEGSEPPSVVARRWLDSGASPAALSGWFI
jgi:hypothetical protein